MFSTFFIDGMDQLKSYQQIVQMLERDDHNITWASFSLISYFDADRKMHFKEGEITDDLLLKQLQMELISLRKSELLFTSTSIGELKVIISDKIDFVIRPVFHQHLNRYKDLLYINDDLLIMTDTMSDFLEKLRK